MQKVGEVGGRVDSRQIRAGEGAGADPWVNWSGEEGWTSPWREDRTGFCYLGLILSHSDRPLSHSDVVCSDL